MPPLASPTIIGRWKAGLLLGLGLAVLVYVGYALHIGAAEVAGALASFHWRWLPLLLVLSLINYGLRFVRWELFLHRLEVRVPRRTSAAVFLAGLAMTLTPGKVGEFLKSYLLKESVGVPMARTAPVVFAERLSDLLALVLLACLGVARYGGPRAAPLLGLAGGGLLAGIFVLQSERVTARVLSLLGRIRPLRGLLGKLAEALGAARALLHPTPLFLGVLLSSLAWWAECLEYLYVFRGFGITTVEHGVAVFGYAFSTLAGVISPGGLGPTDIGLVEIARRATPALQGRDDVAAAAAFIVRVCTLWFAVGLGALALLRFRKLVAVEVDAARGE